MHVSASQTFWTTLTYQIRVLAQARRVLKNSGAIVVSWTSDPVDGKAVKGWQDRTDTQQLDMVKQVPLTIPTIVDLKTSVGL
jgi:hypothetical protein